MAKGEPDLDAIARQMRTRLAPEKLPDQLLGDRPAPDRARQDRQAPAQGRYRRASEKNDETARAGGRARTRLSGHSGRLQARDGAALAFRRHGAGPPLILVHGTAADGRRWAPVIPFLAPFFSVYALDRRGHGDSGEAGAWEFARECDDLADFVAFLGAGPACFIGHSFGAVCVLAAARTPGVARRIALYEPPVPARPGADFGDGLAPAMRRALARGDAGAAASAFCAEIFGMSEAELAAFGKTRGFSEFSAHVDKVLRELEAVRDFVPTPLAGVDALLLTGGESPPPIATPRLCWSGCCRERKRKSWRDRAMTRSRPRRSFSPGPRWSFLRWSRSGRDAPAGGPAQANCNAGRSRRFNCGRGSPSAARTTLSDRVVIEAADHISCFSLSEKKLK